MLVGCVSSLADESACGVAAVGRCQTCGQAYCASHRSRTRALDADECTACESARLRADEASLTAVARRDSLAVREFEAAGRRLAHDLLAAGVVPLAHRSSQRYWGYRRGWRRLLPVPTTVNHRHEYWLSNFTARGSTSGETRDEAFTLDWEARLVLSVSGDWAWVRGKGPSPGALSAFNETLTSPQREVAAYEASQEMRSRLLT